MNGFSGYGNAGSFSWLSSALFEVKLYLRDYEARLNARRFQVMDARGDSRVFYDARYGVGCDTRVGAYIKRLAHWGGLDAVLREDNAP